MDAVAIVAGHAVDLVPAHVPERDGPGFLVAGKTPRCPLVGFSLADKCKHPRASSTAFLNVGSARAVA